MHVQKGRLGRRDIPSRVPCAELPPGHTHTTHANTHILPPLCFEVMIRPGVLKSPLIDGFPGNRGINPFCVFSVSLSHRPSRSIFLVNHFKPFKICLSPFYLRKYRTTRTISKTFSRLLIGLSVEQVNCACDTHNFML